MGTGARRADGAYLIMDAYSECGVQPYGLCHFRLRLRTEEPLPARYQGRESGLSGTSAEVKRERR